LAVSGPFSSTAPCRRCRDMLRGSGRLPAQPINTTISPRPALWFTLSPSTRSLPARLPCPSRFVSTTASPYNAPSGTTLGYSKDKIQTGPSRLPVGGSLVIYRCGQGKPLSLTVSPSVYRRVGT